MNPMKYMAVAAGDWRRVTVQLRTTSIPVRQLTTSFILIESTELKACRFGA